MSIPIRLSASSMSLPGVAIVVPVFNGGNQVAPLLDAIAAAMEGSDTPYEVILVDDGSPDNSWEVISKRASVDPKVRGLRLSRNFGQQIAVSAGIAAASRDYLVVMDCDLQNPPTAIPQILDRLRLGADIVYTVSKVRNNRVDEFTSRAFWFILTRVLNVPIIKNQLMMRGMTRRFARIYDTYHERIRTVAGITSDIGLKYEILEVDNQKRSIGRSGYNLFRRLSLFIDIVISMTARPLHILIYLSLITLVMTVVYLTAFLAYSLFVEIQSGFTTIILSIFFFGSLITLILGVIGIYISNIYTEVRRRPLFIVAESTSDEE